MNTFHFTTMTLAHTLHISRLAPGPINPAHARTALTSGTCTEHPVGSMLPPRGINAANSVQIDSGSFSMIQATTNQCEPLKVLVRV